MQSKSWLPVCALLLLTLSGRWLHAGKPVTETSFCISKPLAAACETKAATCASTAKSSPARLLPSVLIF